MDDEFIFKERSKYAFHSQEVSCLEETGARNGTCLLFCRFSVHRLPRCPRHRP
jgi:hypothetical protein